MNALHRSVVTIAPSRTGATISVGGLHGATDAVAEVIAIASSLGASARQVKQPWDGRVRLNRSAEVSITGDIAAVWAAVQTSRGRTDTALPATFAPRAPTPVVAHVDQRMPGSAFTESEGVRYRMHRRGLGQ